MESPTLYVDDFAVVGKPNPRTRYANILISRAETAATIKIERVRRWNAGADHNRAAVFLQPGIVKNRQIEVFVSVGCGLDNRDTFGRGHDNGREDVIPILHGDIFVVRSRGLQLNENNVAGFELAGRISQALGQVKQTIDDG